MTSFARNTGGASFVDLLKDGSKHYSGVDEAISRNIEACMKLSTIVRTSLGPNGMNKMVVNHLDKISIYSHGGYQPKVIIRVGVPTNKPLDPQVQHMGNYSDPFRQMLKTVEVIELTGEHQVFDAYRKAYERSDGRSTLIVEHTSRYA